MIRSFKERKKLVCKNLEVSHRFTVEETLKDELQWLEGVILTWEKAFEERQGKIF